MKGYFFKKASAAVTLCAVLALSGCSQAQQADRQALHATLPPQTTQSAPEASVEETTTVLEDGAILVSTVDQFLAAIAPDTTIELAPGSYTLSDASNYPADGKQDDRVAGSSYYHWYNRFDGFGLYITGVQNLTIRAQDRAETSILAVPRYADVLNFDSCTGITLENLTMGHTTEAGGCVGAVVGLAKTRDVNIQGCRLFGCGTWGIQADTCQNVLAQNNIIDNCSMGAVTLSRCYNFQLDGSEIYGCRSEEGLLNVVQSEEVAMTNTRVHDNLASRMVSAQYGSKGVYLGGVDVYANAFSQCLYSAGHTSIVFDKCQISSNNQLPKQLMGSVDGDDKSAGFPAVDAKGKTLTDEALLAGKQADVTWKAKERQSVQAPQPWDDGSIHVSNVDELLAAIAPNTTICLEKGEYNLSKASNYGELAGEYYSWAQEFDGYSLVISNVDNLTISGTDPKNVWIKAEPRYADVIRFEGCSKITLMGFVAGHTEDKGSCTGDVLTFQDTTDIFLEECFLYGCGVHGINAERVKNMLVRDTEIYGCEYQAAILWQSQNVEFEDCRLYENGTDVVFADSCTNVTWNGTPVEELYDKQDKQA